MEEKHKTFFSKEKGKANIKVLHLGGKFKFPEEYLMIPESWLYLHTFQNRNGSNLACELETLFHCHENNPIKLLKKMTFLIEAQ